MTHSSEFPDTFYRVASNVLKRYPQVQHKWTLNEQKNRRELLLPSTQSLGFDVGVYCETYGLYPWAGAYWWGPCWDINTPNTTLDEMSNQVLALLRILLSPESRIRVDLRRKKALRYLLEFATPSGWHVYDKHYVNFAAWFGKREEVVYQNWHLARRDNFDGSDPLWFQHYRWMIENGDTR